MINNRKLNLICLVLGLLLLLMYGLMARSVQPVEAGPQLRLCNRQHLPIAVRQGPVAPPPTAQPVASTAVPLCPPVFPDFNGDGYADLALGTPHEDVIQGDTFVDAGAAHVIYGSDHGLEGFAAQAAVDDQLWSRAVAGMATLPLGDADHFGGSLGIGDFNADGYDDLAIGVPGSVAIGHLGAGAVQVLYGTPAGLTTTDTQTWTQASPGIAGIAADLDNFGSSLVASDFNGDGYADLAIGVTNEMVDEMIRAGAVHIIYGSADGLSTPGAGGGLPAEYLTQETFPFFAAAEPNDQFGTTLAAADFNDDGFADLAVGVPSEDFANGLDNAGIVQIYHGSAQGIVDPDPSVPGPFAIHADTQGVDNAREAFDYFGYALAAADFNNDGFADLAIGTPYETHGSGVGALQGAGAINIVFGASFGLNPTAGAPIWHQDSPGMAGEAAAEDYFGWSMTAADFDGDGYIDLAIGVPLDKVLGAAIGSVHIMYSDEDGPNADRDVQRFLPGNPEVDDRFGITVTSLDTNGDSFPELIVGASHDDVPGIAATQVGSVFEFFSDATGVTITGINHWYQGHNGLSGVPEDMDHMGASLP
ncbi:MAG: FG-GAP repeat protein [Anaerolineales bacterium]|nr:FG-GAP repeat protein [Anaerolineales bacterium]